MTNGNILEVAKNVENVIFKKVNESYNAESQFDEKVIAATMEVVPQMGEKVEMAEWYNTIYKKAFGKDYAELSTIFTKETIKHFEDLIKRIVESKGIIVESAQSQQTQDQNVSNYINSWTEDVIDIWSDGKNARIQFRRNPETDKWIGVFSCFEHPEEKKSFVAKSTQALKDALSSYSIVINCCGESPIRFVDAAIDAKELNLL